MFTYCFNNEFISIFFISLLCILYFYDDERCKINFPVRDNKVLLYCIVLYCIVLYCIVLYCIVLYCIVLYCITLSKILFIFLTIKSKILVYRYILCISDYHNYEVELTLICVHHHCSQKC